MLNSRRIAEGTGDYFYALDLYDFSFPRYEQIDIRIIMAVSGSDAGDFFVILDGETRVGTAYMLYGRDLVYLYYLAVDPGFRGKGYGSDILAMIKDSNPGCRIALNSEAPDETAANYLQRLDRIRFYEKNGFRDTGIRMPWRGVVFALMTYGGDVSVSELLPVFAKESYYAYKFRRR